jgi:hypothetical protein
MDLQSSQGPASVNEERVLHVRTLNVPQM